MYELEEIKKLKSQVSKLKRERIKINRMYNSELKANNHLINANTRLQNENKWLKRDLERIPEVLKYIESCKGDVRYSCNVKKIKNILRGIKEQNLDNTV